MTIARRRKKALIWILTVIVLMVFWFVTAPAGMAIERIASGMGRGPFARMVSDAFQWYASPMQYCVKIPILAHMSDYLEDKWCSLLDAPETTP